MTVFPNPVLDYWHRAFAADHVTADGRASCAVSGKLNPKRPAMILEMTDGTVRMVVTPEIAGRSGIGDLDEPSFADLKGRLERVGLTFHDPDCLFYFPPRAPVPPGDVGGARRLTDADRTAFDIFYNTASEQDRDDAWVELDHWAVFGCFEDDRLVSAASMTLWDDDPIVDLGVLTLADARGRGFARTVVQAISRFSRQRGREPQYRCQLDNHASLALARSCDLQLFGQWTVAVDPSMSGAE